MAKHVQLKLQNDTTEIPAVRFIGVNFSGETFLYDVKSGEEKRIVDVFRGYIGLTAYRGPDEAVIGTISYPITNTKGFAARVIHDNTKPDRPIILVGEEFTHDPDQ
jgi:hypothetical protein